MYEKHELNFFPEIDPESFETLKNSIANGFDSTLGKITLYEGKVLDGWNRYRACQETSQTPVFTQFDGNEQDAFLFSVRANQERRHLSKSQLAMIAINSEGLWSRIQEKAENERKRKIAEARQKQEAEKQRLAELEKQRIQDKIRRDNERKIEAERKEKERVEREKALAEKLQREKDEAERKRIQDEKQRIENERLEAIQLEKERIEKEKQAEKERVEREKQQKEMAQKVAPSGQEKSNKETRTKLATVFNTNRQYISDAKKIKAENPELSKKIESGEMSISEAKKVVKQKKLEHKKAEITASLKKEIKTVPNAYKMDCKEFLNRYDDNSIDLLITDPPYSTDVDDISGFAESWLPLALSKVKSNGRGYVCIGAYPKEIKAYLDIFLSQDKFILDNPLIWTYRNTLGITPKDKYNLNYQMILHFYSKDAEPLDTSITNEMFSVQDINAPDGRQGDRYHTWQKPNELARRMIMHSTKEGDKIVDCFCCTGTFLLMGAKLNRISEGCDINAENLNIAKERGVNVI